MSTDPSQTPSSPPPADRPSSGTPADSGGAAKKPPLALRRPVPGSPQRRHFTSAPTPSVGPGSAAARSKPAPAPVPSAPSALSDSSDATEQSAADAIRPLDASVPEATDLAATASETNSPETSSAEIGAPEAPLAKGPASPNVSPSGKKGKGRGKTDPLTDELRVPPPPKPHRHEKMTSELEAELAAAFGGRSLDQMLGDGGVAAAKELTELESRRSATVVRVHGDNVFFVLGGRNEGVASVRQFATPPEPGQMFDVIVKGLNAEDGLYELHIPGASIEVSDWGDLNEGSIVEALVTGANTGGLECTVNKIRGFIPMSQVALYRIENAAEFIGQKVLCVVTEANPQRRNLVLSRRAVLEREKEESRRKFYEDLQVGQVHEGIVRKIEDFGAFVDLGGADGLIHVSQMSWERVKDPREVVKEGQKVQVRIEKFDPQTGKIGLSLRSLQENPWTDIDSRFPIGSTVRGTVSRLANFGAFVKLAPGVEGLVHISELSNVRVSQVGKVVQEGQEVEVKILSVDRENQRIGLSLKAAQAGAAPAEAKEEPEEPPRQPVIKKRPGPLKGGFDRGGDAEKLGLKW